MSSATAHDTEDTSNKTVWDIICAAEEKSTFTSKEFIPEGKLNQEITKLVITEALYGKKHLKKKKDEGLVHFIHSQAIKLFATTVRFGFNRRDLRKAMEEFRSYEISDEKCLPFTEVSWRDKGLFSSDHESDDSSGGSDDERPWNPARTKLFLDYQHIVMAPVFNLDKGNHDLEDTAILPFTDEPVNLGFGSFGEVYKYGIHPAHMKCPSDLDFKCPEFIAVKKINPGEGQERKDMVESWEREASVLLDMNKLKQEHIVPFLTAFRHGLRGEEKHYLIFPWARGKNLRHLWNDMSRPTLSIAMVQWATQQILGLAEAIYSAHEPYMYCSQFGIEGPFIKDGLKGDFFRHGDLKPENILWFKENDHDMGTLKIGDWGLAKRQNIPTQLRTNRTTTVFGTLAYEPPEERTGETVNRKALDPGKKDIKRRSRLYDIWAMGCIALEFLIWLLYGKEGLTKFHQSFDSPSSSSNAYYELKQDRHSKWYAVVHPVVLEWMEHIAKDPACQGEETALKSLLLIIKDRLLVVELPSTLGSDIDQAAKATRATTDNSVDVDDDLQAADLPPKPQGNVPSIIVTDAPKVNLEETEGHHDPLKNKIRKGRARAKQFYSSMTAIYDTEDRDEDYWLPSQPGHPLFPNLKLEPSVQLTKNVVLEEPDSDSKSASIQQGLLRIVSSNENPTRKGSNSQLIEINPPRCLIANPAI